MGNLCVTLSIALFTVAVASGVSLASGSGKSLEAREEAQDPYEEANAELNDKLEVSKELQGSIQSLRLRERIKEIEKDTLRQDSR